MHTGSVARAWSCGWSWFHKSLPMGMWMLNVTCMTPYTLDIFKFHSPCLPKNVVDMLQAAMPMPPTVDRFMQVLSEYDGGSGERNVVGGGGDDLFGRVFEGSHVGALTSGTTEKRKSAAVAAIKFDKTLKEKGISTYRQ